MEVTEGAVNQPSPPLEEEDDDPVVAIELSEVQKKVQQLVDNYIAMATYCILSLSRFIVYFFNMPDNQNRKRMKVHWRRAVLQRLQA